MIAHGNDNPRAGIFERERSPGCQNMLGVHDGHSRCTAQRRDVRTHAWDNAERGEELPHNAVLDRPVLYL
jgi:hypothetical protein